MKARQGRFVRVLVGFLLVYAALVLVTLGLFFDRFSMTLLPDVPPVEIVNQSLVATFITLFFLRFLLQKTPRMKVVPYLHLPIQQHRLVTFFQTASLLSVHNIYPLFFFIPFWMRFVVAGDSIEGNLMWIGAIILLILSSHFANLLIRGILRRQVGLFYLLMTILIGTAYIDEVAGVGLQQRMSGFMFSDLLSGSATSLVLFLAWAFFVMVASTFHLARSLSDPEGEHGEKLPDAHSFQVPDEWGILGHLVRSELLLMWRNRRPRHYLLLSIFFSTFYLVLMLSSGDVFGGVAFPALLGLFASGGFALNYGQLMFCWDAANYQALITRNIAFHTMVRAKLIVLRTSCLLLFLLSLPLFIALRPDLVALHTAFLFYNVGITSALVMELATRNKQRLDVTQGGGFFNFEGISARHMLWIIPTALPPVLFLQAMHESPDLGLTILALIGLGSLIFTEPLTRYFARGLRIRKHTMVEGFTVHAR
jgi:hypothetical protein